MAEKVSTDLDGKIESAMPKEDANQTPVEPIQGPSFVKDPAKQAQENKRQVTTLDVLLYLGKQLKTIKEQNESLTELLKKVLEKLNYSVPATQPIQSPSPEPHKTFEERLKEPIVDAGLEKVNTALFEYLKDGSLTLNATENNMFYIVKSTKFLGTDNFSKIAGIVRGLGGEYVSQGKASHFKIPKATK